MNKVITYMLAFMMFCLLGYRVGQYSAGNGHHAQRDTITLPPIVKTQIKVDTLYQYFPLPSLSYHTSDTIYFPEGKALKETKVYTDDSTYTAVVSGVQPSLDSISVYQKTKYINQLVYRDVIKKEKEKRWGIGISAGYGLPHGPYIGIGINYNLFRW